MNQHSHGEKPVVLSKGGDFNKKRKGTFSKILAAFGRSSKKPRTSGSSCISELVSEQRIGSSSLVNGSSASSSSAFAENNSYPPEQRDSRATLLGSDGPDSNTAVHFSGQQYFVRAHSEMGSGAQTAAALPPVTNASPCPTNDGGGNSSSSSSLRATKAKCIVDGGGGGGVYPIQRVSRRDMPDRRSLAGLANAATAANWRAAAAAASRSTTNHQTMAAARAQQRSRAGNEMDILSFFDTGSIEYGDERKGICVNTGSNGVAYPGRESRDNTAAVRPPLPPPPLGTGSGQPAVTGQLMLEDKEKVLRRRRKSYGDDDEDAHAGKEVAVDNFADGQMRRRAAAAALHLQTVESSRRRSPSSFWYCEKMAENESECESAVVDPTAVNQLSQNKASRLQRSGAAPGFGRILSRPLSAEEKKRLAKTGAIVLATAGLAALIMLLIKYKKQAARSAMCCDDDGQSCASIDEDEDGVCLYEKFDRIRCQNSNFKALMTNTEKLVEQDDKVCALQDYRKLTKRMKDPAECTTQDPFCPRANINKRKCFGNF